MYGDSSNIKKRDPNKASLGIRKYNTYSYMDSAETHRTSLFSMYVAFF